MNTEIPDQPEGTDPLDELLREQTIYVEDRGFTTRVIQSLPRRRPQVLRAIILLSASAIGVALAILWLPWDSLRPLDSAVSISEASRMLDPWLLAWTIWFSLAWAIINALRSEVDLF